MRRFITLSLVCALSVSAAAVAGAATGDPPCPMALATTVGQYVKHRLLVTARCRMHNAGTCNSARIDQRLARFDDKQAEKLLGFCSDAELLAIAPEGVCPDPSGRCNLPVTNGRSALACITCMASSGMDALGRVMSSDSHGDMNGDFCGGCPGQDCGPGGFCEHEAGGCNDPFAQGTCVEWNPGIECPTELAPVCGCDGVTYPNDCERLKARTSKAHDGACDTLPAPCSSDSICPNDQFCEPAPGQCDQPFQDGKCVTPPQACPQIYAPVCGCDGNTYSNDCEREAARVAKDHDGECTGATTCGGPDATPCDAGQFCDQLPGMCSIEDRPGRCVEVPQDCGLEDSGPVCGCDGITYASDCLRRAAMVSMAHPGSCEQQCAGIAGLTCPDGQTCVLPPGSCQVSDAIGLCMPTPDVCPMFMMPVCGCDGTTYGNLCDLIKAGVGLDHRGSCDQTEPGPMPMH